MSGSGRRALFAYIGDEQRSWGRQAFASARHYYVMPGVLRLAAALRSGSESAGLESVEVLFFNRGAQSAGEMELCLAEADPDLLGLSCFSWNIDGSLELARGAVERSGGRTRVVLGGPEVAFARAAEARRFLEEHRFVSGLALGEGEPVIAELARVALGGSAPDGGVAGAVVRCGDRVVVGPPAPPADLSRLPEIDASSLDVPRSPGTGLAVVCETCRGCPYSCDYCSFSGGSRGIRRFLLERVRRELVDLLRAEVDAIHFADSVFDLANDRAAAILETCIEHNRRTSLFCYAAFQGLDDRLAELLERSRIQVGVGLQSVDESVLRRVNRRFGVDSFRRSVELLGRRRREVNYTVDVMFGLPGDDIEGFARTVDEAVELGARHLMPFPLTLIPRTALAADPDGYGIVRYDDEEILRAVRPLSGIVYADIGLFRQLRLDDLRRFDDVATAVFYAVQRSPESFAAVARYATRTAERGHGLGPFAVLERIGSEIRERIGDRSVDIDDPPALGRAVLDTLIAILARAGAGETVRAACEQLFRLESAAALLLERPDRRRHHRLALGREERRVEADRTVSGERSALTVAFTARSRPITSEFEWRDLLRLGELGERIERRPVGLLISAPYDDWRIGCARIDEAGRALCEAIPSDREVRLSSLQRRLSRRFGESWLRSLRDLAESKAIGIYEEEER
ncbi:MAG: B12-binding domain-containing radical SAM protein [Polyangia bacterium]